MKAPRVTINNLFAGYLLAGTDPQDWEAMTDEQRIGAQLDFIEARARLLMELPHDPRYGLPANLQVLAKRLYRQVQEAVAAMSQGQTVRAGGYMLQVGVTMQSVSTHLAAVEALDVTEKLQRPRSAGGQETARVKKEAATENMEKAADHWQKLEAEGRPERERAPVIAKRMGFPVNTVRGWIRKAGLR